MKQQHHQVHSLPQGTARQRRRRGLLFVAIGVLVLGMLANGSGVWAEAGLGPLRGTVPTPTPKTQPTKPPQAGPPTPTRVVPPTRTPCANCPTPVPVTELPPSDLLVNVGGEEYTDATGKVWQADQEYVADLTTWGYVNGEAETGSFMGEMLIGKTADSKLYQDERWAMSGYRFELANAVYEVTLKFAEQFVKATGERVFSVQVGDQLLKDIDILAESGAPFSALDRVVTVTVSSKLLRIDFLAQIENPTLAAIAIHSLLPPTPTPGPTNTPAPTETPPPTETPVPPTATTSPTPSPTSTALPSTARVAAIFPGAESALRSADGAVFARIPQNAVGEAMQMIYIPADELALPHPEPGFRMGSVAFSLRAADSRGVVVSDTLLAEPIVLNVRYSAADIEAADHEFARLVLANYRPELKQWVAVESANDTVNAALSGRTRRLGLYAIMVRALPSVRVGGTELMSTTTLIAGAAALVLLGLVVGYGWGRRKA